MKNKTRHIYALIIVSVVLSITSFMLSRENAKGSEPCQFITGDWGPCDQYGKQWRNVSFYPKGCDLDESLAPSDSQSCSNPAPPSCTSFDYSSWTECDPFGKQTRTVTTKHPDGCVISDPAPVLEQSCTYIPSSYLTGTKSNTKSSNGVVCAYITGEWSECTNGIQTRSISRTPSGCYDDPNTSNIPSTQRSCTTSSPSVAASGLGEPCSYSTSSWSNCTPSGIQTRTITSKTPSGCYDANTPTLQQSCTYNSYSINSAVACKYEYSSWSECNSSGKQIRAIISKTPSGCKESTASITEQSCQYFASNITQDSSSQNQNTASSSSQVNYNGLTSQDWQKKYFKSQDCMDENFCGGLADPDKDSLSNNDEYRYGTNPLNPDTDGDGYSDGEEIKNGFNPLLKASSSSKEKIDKMAYDNPKETGEVKSNILKVENVSSLKTENNATGITLSGKGLPNSYVTIFVYSSLPTILTVKTDSNGSWSYTLDKELDNGEHEAYVAVTDNTGKITAKSEPLTFFKTAEAVSVIPPAEADSSNRLASPTQKRQDTYLIISLIMTAITLTLSLVAIGMRTSSKKENEIRFFN